MRVIPRDVKSVNVLLDRGCHGRIGDFGIARSLKDNEGGIASTHLQTEHVVGTQVYMAPEYHRSGELSTKVDTFAFGLVIIEMLTGYAVCQSRQVTQDYVEPSLPTQSMSWVLLCNESMLLIEL